MLKNTTTAKTPSSNPAKGNTKGASSAVKLSGTELLNRLSGSISASSSGDALKTFAAAFNELISGDTKLSSDGYKISAHDADSNGLSVSSVLLYKTEGAITSVYTMLVEATAKDLSPDEFTDKNGQRHNVPFTCADLYSDALLASNFESLARVHKLDVEKVYDAGGLVLPIELSSEDKDSIHCIVYRATHAINSVLQGESAEEVAVWSIPAINTDITQFTGEVVYHPSDLLSATGLPIRSDVNIRVNTRDRNASRRDQRENRAMANGAAISSVSAFVDFMYAGSDVIRDVRGAQIGVTTQVYSPLVCITDTNTVHAITSELQLHALSSIHLLSNGLQSQVWRNVVSSPAPAGKVQRDIRSLSNECMAEAISPKDATFNALEFLEEFVDANVTYVLHVEDAGELSWMTSTIRDAASGNTDSRDYLFDVAMNLTGGKMEKYWDPADSIGVVEKDARIFIGYWLDSAGVKRDLREIDAVWAMTHFGSSDLELATDFCNTFKPTHGELEVRLARRKDLIERMVQSSIFIKGYATPVILSNLWLAALSASVKECGGDVNFGQLYYGEARVQREYAGMRAYAAAAVTPHAYQQYPSAAAGNAGALNTGSFRRVQR